MSTDTILAALSVLVGLALWWQNRDLAKRHRDEVERQKKAVRHLEKLNTDLTNEVKRQEDLNTDFQTAIASLVRTTALQRTAVRNIRRSVLFVVLIIMFALALASLDQPNLPRRRRAKWEVPSRARSPQNPLPPP